MAASTLGPAPVWRISNGRIDRLIVFARLGDEIHPAGEIVLQGGARVRQGFFRYARTWLDHAERRPLAPLRLPLRRTPIDGVPHEVPLPFYDAGPDGWGKAILAYAWPSQTFGMGEFLAATGDERTGDLRFGPSPEEGPQKWAPTEEPAVNLPAGTETLDELLTAARALEEGHADRHHVHLLLRSGADVGGARPKARIRHRERGWIAKFPALGDPFDDPRVEGACLALAHACGIDASESEWIQIERRSVLLVRRFDRGEGERPLAYCSAATLLGQAAIDYATDHSYADIAARARSSGIRPCEDELFRRLLFNCFIHNTDDHLRNHAFVLEQSEWALSPAFDLVPHLTERLVLRPGRDIAPTPDPTMALGAHPQFGLSRVRARTIYDEVATGMAALSDVLARFEVSMNDRNVLAQMMPHAFAPPALDP
jgi:serine/threonine-protein kinase HipA